MREAARRLTLVDEPKLLSGVKFALVSVEVAEWYQLIAQQEEPRAEDGD